MIIWGAFFNLFFEVRVMKNIWHKLVVFGLFLFIALGCGAINQIKKEVEKTQSPQVLISTDGCCQITVPGTWRTDNSLNEQATLQASNRSGELYVAVIRESKGDYGKTANLDFLTNLLREHMRKTVSDSVLTEPIAVTIGGYPAKQFEVSGEVENIKVSYLYSVVDTPQNFYQVITWTLTSRMENNRPKLLEVINSFKEVNAGDSLPPIPAATIKKPTKSK